MLDVNSLYPSVMYTADLPFGEGLFFEGKYQDDKVYPLYIQMITCSFKIKPNKIPTIQIKGSMYFTGNEYLLSSESEEGGIVCLVLTNVDLKLFFEQYDVEDLKYIAGWKYRSIKGLFTEYIDKWINVKIEATKKKNKGERAMAKMMLNSLYGKFATSLEVQSKIPFLGEDGIIHYTLSEKEDKEGIYLPVGIFITSYAREKTIRTSQAIKDFTLKNYNEDYSIKNYGIDKYIYSDTDSIHTTLSIEELKQFCDIDDVRLGAWAHEGYATKAKFVRQKCYLENLVVKRKFKGKKIQNLKSKCYNNIKWKHFTDLKITCAGMPARCYHNVTWESFKEGFSCGDKLAFKHVKGGVMLVETEFTIKADKVTIKKGKQKKGKKK